MIIDVIEKEQMKKASSQFSVGDQVDVSVKIVEGDKERIQVFGGVVIAKNGGGFKETFAVRRIVQGEGVERVFPIHSPKIVDIKVIKSGRVRRAKLYYIVKGRAKERDCRRSMKIRHRKVYQPKAVVSPDVTMGENVVVGHLSVVSSWCRIGDGVVIGSTTNIGHHGRIRGHAFLAGHTVLAGSVDVGERAFIGTGVTIRDNVTIGAASVVGAGATILGDVEPNSVYAAERGRKLSISADQVRL